MTSEPPPSSQPPASQPPAVPATVESQPPPPQAEDRLGYEAPGEQRPGPGGAWGPGRALLGLGLLLVLLALEVGVAAAFDPDLESLAATLALQAALAATLVGVAFLVANPDSGGLASPASLGLRRPLGPVVKLTILAYLVYFVCAIVIAALLAPEQEDVTRQLGADEGALGTVAAGLLIIGAAPISEELFFRAFMFGGLRRGLPFALAALISGGIWGLFHFTGAETWGVVLQLTVFGVVLCWLYERTGSLWPPVAVHAFNNALAFTILVA